jgi:hypothetical protein
MTAANEKTAREIEQTKCVGHEGSITIREKVCVICLTTNMAAALDEKDKEKGAAVYQAFKDAEAHVAEAEARGAKRAEGHFHGLRRPR